MAIEKTIFIGTDLVALAPEVIGWLKTNAADYFDNFDVGTVEGVPIYVRCCIGEAEALKLGFDGTVNTFTVSLKNGVSLIEYSSSKKFDYVVKTSYGIYLHISNNQGIFITKTNKNSVAFVFVSQYSNSTSNYRLYSGDFENSAAFDANSAGVISSAWSVLSKEASLTSFSPWIFPGQSYAPNLFVTPQTQYLGVDGNIMIDGTSYFYNGYFALRE